MRMMICATLTFPTQKETAKYMDQQLKPLKTWTVNIGSEENPQYATIGDYWDDEMVSKVTQLLHEYQDLFLMKFSEIKGIIEVVEDILSWVEV